MTIFGHLLKIIRYIRNPIFKIQIPATLEDGGVYPAPTSPTVFRLNLPLKKGAVKKGPVCHSAVADEKRGRPRRQEA